MRDCRLEDDMERKRKAETVVATANPKLLAEALGFAALTREDVAALLGSVGACPACGNPAGAGAVGCDRECTEGDEHGT